MNTFILILRWIWEFPQCLLGWLLTKIYAVEYKETYKDAKVFSGDFPGGISLGQYILMSDYDYRHKKLKVKEHESGHCVQSKILGWLYLPIVGILSGLWAGFIHQYFYPHKSYYWFITERGADYHAGIKR